jgi:hypothetical protein
MLVDRIELGTGDWTHIEVEFVVPAFPPGSY